MFSETRFSGTSLIPPNPKLFGWDRPETVQIPRIIRARGYPELLQSWLDDQRLADAANRLATTWEALVGRYPRLAELSARTVTTQGEPTSGSDETSIESTTIHFDRSFLSRCQRGHVPSKAGGRALDPRHITIAVELAAWETAERRLDTLAVTSIAREHAGRIAELLAEDREQSTFHLGDALEVLKELPNLRDASMADPLLKVLAAAAGAELGHRTTSKAQLGGQSLVPPPVIFDQAFLHQLRAALEIVPYRKAPLVLGHLCALHALQDLVDQCIRDWAHLHNKLNKDPGAEILRSLYTRAFDRGNRDWSVNCILLD